MVLEPRQYAQVEFHEGFEVPDVLKELADFEVGAVAERKRGCLLDLLESPAAPAKCRGSLKV